MLDPTFCPERFCQYCGWTDVTDRRAYAGGVGYVSVTECVNKRACSRRQELLANVDDFLSLTPAPASEASRLTAHRRAS